MSEQYIVNTPENISFGYDVAGIGSRFLAVFVDSLIQSTVYIFLFIVLVLVSAFDSLISLPRAVSDLVPVIVLIVLFLVQFGYFMLFELITGGQTPGKRLFNLRVIKENGYPLAPVDSVIRNLIRIIDFFPFAYGTGVIVMFLNDRAKRLGDFAAGTLVVKMRADVRLSSLTAPSPSGYAPELPGIEKLHEADIELIESFLQRRPQLQDAGTLAGSIARTIRARMDSPEIEERASHISHEEFLRQVAAAYRKAHQRH